MTFEQMETTLHALDERTAQILGLLEQLTTAQVLNKTEVCERFLGRSREWARTRPWAYPRFTQQDVPGQNGGWYLRTCLDWYSVPLDERRREWESKSTVERREIVGRKAS